MNAVCEHEWAEFRRLDRIVVETECGMETALAAYDKCEAKYTKHLEACLQHGDITSLEFNTAQQMGIGCRTAYMEWLITCYT